MSLITFPGSFIFLIHNSHNIPPSALVQAHVTVASICLSNIDTCNHLDFKDSGVGGGHYWQHVASLSAAGNNSAASSSSEAKLYFYISKFNE